MSKTVHCNLINILLPSTMHTIIWKCKQHSLFCT